MTANASDTGNTHYALYWLAAARSAFAKPADWKAWADKRIQESDAPDTWIIELSLANDCESLAAALASEAEKERQGLRDPNVEDAVLGYVWLRYERGQISLEACLGDLGRLSDNYETVIECEVFYALLNRLERAPTTGDERVTIEAEAKARLSALREEASRQWHILSA